MGLEILSTFRSLRLEVPDSIAAVYFASSNKERLYRNVLVRTFTAAKPGCDNFLNGITSFICLPDFVDQKSRDSSIDDGKRVIFISISSRIKWIHLLFFCFSSFLVVVIGSLAYTLVKWKYVPEVNYLYALVTSAILFVISYRFTLDSDLLSPNFIQKYQFTKKIDLDKRDQLIKRLDHLMTVEKIYLQQELKLEVLAEKMEILGHQLSKLINEKYQKTFNEFINELRVTEFIARLNDDKYKSYSIYGIAMDIGFNSKSSFNNIFKKITGKTPSQYKRS